MERRNFFGALVGCLVAPLVGLRLFEKRTSGGGVESVDQLEKDVVCGRTNGKVYLVDRPLELQTGGKIVGCTLLISCADHWLVVSKNLVHVLYCHIEWIVPRKQGLCVIPGRGNKVYA